MEGVLEHEDAFRSTLEQLLDLPIVGDVRGAGFFYAIELVKDSRRARRSPTRSASGYCAASSPAHVRARAHLPRRRPGDPVIQISPPLVAGQAEFDRRWMSVLVRDPGRRREQLEQRTVAPGLRRTVVAAGRCPGPRAPRSRGHGRRRRHRRRRLYVTLDQRSSSSVVTRARRIVLEGGALRDRAQRTERRVPPRLLVEPGALPADLGAEDSRPRRRPRGGRRHSRRSRPSRTTSGSGRAAGAGVDVSRAGHDPRPLPGSRSRARRRGGGGAAFARSWLGPARARSSAGVFYRDGAATPPASCGPAPTKGSLTGVRLHERTKVTRIDNGLLDTKRGSCAHRGRRRHQRLGGGWKPLSRLLTPFGATSSSPSRCPTCSPRSAGPAARRSPTAACSCTTSGRPTTDAC